MKVAGFVVLIATLVALIVLVLIAAWINPVLFLALLLGVGLGTAMRALRGRKRRRGDHAGDRRKTWLLHPLGVVVGLGVTTFAVVVAGVALVNEGGDFSMIDPGVIAVEQVEFELLATLQERDGRRNWDLETTVRLDSDNIDRLLDAMDHPRAAPFEELPEVEREIARLVVFQQLAASDFGVSPRDFDDSITVSQRTTREIADPGWMPGDWLVSETLALPTVRVVGVLLEPNAGSVIRITSACNAFMRVSPPGTAQCTNDDEERTISLDQPGSRERSSVTGSVVPDALRYATPIVDFSLKSSASASIAFLLGVVPAVFSDRIKRWVAARFDDEPATTELELVVNPTRKDGDGDDWTVVLESVGWPPGESITAHIRDVRDGRLAEWNHLGTTTASSLGAVRAEYDVQCPDGEGRRFKITSADHRSTDVGFGRAPNT